MAVVTDTRMTQSLFSLEIHVESVEELKVTCRLPAVSFRLLDFPTLIVHYVSPIMAEKLRQKLKMETGAKEPSLEELKDRLGNFKFQKGKSCLFKANIDVLRTQLQTTPLYVMLLDLWPKRPLLVGSGVIQMKTAMDAIHRHVSAKGIAVPSFYKQYGDFDLFNLMGTAVASIKLGYRLVSLGGSLIAHVPAVSRRESEEKNIEENMVQASATDPVPPDVDLKFTEMNEVPKQHDRQTQTSSVRARLLTQASADHDLVLTNTICPPPLYFNCYSASQTKENTETPGAVINGNNFVEDNVDFVYDDSGELDGNVGCTSVAVQTDVPRPEQPTMGLQRGTVMPESADGLQNLFTLMECSPSQLPLLNALLQELSSITTQRQQQQQQQKSSQPNDSREYALSKQKGKVVSDIRRTATSSAKPNILSKGAAVKRTVPSVPLKSPVTGLSRQKVRFKPTHLTYKTTRTQQMRLEMNLKAKQERLQPCTAVAQELEHSVTPKHKPKEKFVDLGGTYRKDSGNVGRIGAMMTHSAKQGDNQAEHKDERGTDVTEVTEPLKPSEDTVSPVESTMESARSYKSQNSLEVFLPTADGETDESSHTEEVLSSIVDSRYGHTGIPSPEAMSFDNQLTSTLTPHSEDFGDTKPWHGNKTVDSTHTSLQNSGSHVSSTSSEQSSGTNISCVDSSKPFKSESPTKTSRSHRCKGTDNLGHKVALSDTDPKVTSSANIPNPKVNPPELAHKQSFAAHANLSKENESTTDESYSEDFHSGSEEEQNMSRHSETSVV